ncbi:hypothetical protein COV05_03170 [Candidatus Uhrbacteria bacterium CG10_big_fil_rev_8_21_14_0_10_48_16]|uniref:Uncharacterized protein n=1 Tax=Candidatus Uhrbacteria bacterium CG10_big_fil_rev_8_21_14_0_10_48_16 TaxID=1975038 RepID=A0A2M8LH11_9BACT|nr:MAG: hypothetical protein COV05_03170 [Candidatus Uhrbacteria bacterium CG10_big_fil_rev_8_21_14_0_10_48_16]
MRQTQLVGTARFTQANSEHTGKITIVQGIQSIFNLVTIENVGQGKVKFDRDGSFRGSWAMNNEIYDVDGKAHGDQSSWDGTFILRHVETSAIIARGSFHVEKTSR